jgi:hypothetical protein
MQLLQRHYKTVIVPAVESDTVEAATCAAGLEAMTKAVEGRATATLCDAFSDLAKQVHCFIPLLVAQSVLLV